jgi:hypothetical protein
MQQWIATIVRRRIKNSGFRDHEIFCPEMKCEKAPVFAARLYVQMRRAQVLDWTSSNSPRPKAAFAIARIGHLFLERFCSRCNPANDGRASAGSIAARIASL